MKRLSQYLIFAAVIGMSACTKVIEVDIDQAPARVVIEAEVINGAGPHMVHLSSSVGISDASVFPEIQGAFVTITDDEGNADTLLEATAGHYFTQDLPGRPTHSYTLSVTVGAETFTATSTMPALVPMDSVFNLNASLFGGTRYPVIVRLSDPIGVKNQYRFISVVNGIREASSISSNDDFFDGQSAEVFLPGLGANLKPGDSLTLTMQSIDASVYEYFSSFGSTAGGPGGSSAPANPYTNLTGGALGYFNACAVDVRAIVIQ